MKTSLEQAMLRRISRKVKARHQDNSFSENSYIYSGDFGKIQRNKANGEVSISNLHGSISVSPQGEIVKIKKSDFLSSKFQLLRKASSDLDWIKELIKVQDAFRKGAEKARVYF